MSKFPAVHSTSITAAATSSFLELFNLSFIDFPADFSVLDSEDYPSDLLKLAQLKGELLDNIGKTRFSY
jgi:hypothetical protein